MRPHRTLNMLIPMAVALSATAVAGTAVTGRVDLMINGLSGGDRFGQAVATADIDGYGFGSALAGGDVDGDGFQDLVIGAYYADGPDNLRRMSGEVVVANGNPARRESIDLVLGAPGSDGPPVVRQTGAVMVRFGRPE